MNLFKKKNKIVEEPVVHPNWEVFTKLTNLVEKYSKDAPSCASFINPMANEKNIEGSVNDMLLWYTEQYFKLLCELQYHTQSNSHCGRQPDTKPTITIDKTEYSKIKFK